MNTYNEKEIIALLQDPARQKEAFECIVNEYSEQLYWQIRRMVLSHEDANDLLQNTFIKAWTNLEYFRAEAKMSTWLYRIALNECLTFLNKQRATNQLSIDDADADICFHLLIGHFSARYEDESILLQEASDIFPNTPIS